MEAKLMVGGRTRLRPQGAGFVRKFITPVPMDLESSNLVGVQATGWEHLWWVAGPDSAHRRRGLETQAQETHKSDEGL